MPQAQRPTGERANHWDSVYETRGARGVSWHQADPAISLELLETLRVPPDAAVIDVGGGASSLTRSLLDRGFTDLSVLDVSSVALAEARKTLSDGAQVSWIHADVLAWRPERRFDVWHDRAVSHFLIDPRDRENYLQTLLAGIKPGGAVVIATFAADGPQVCSGLPVVRYSAAELAQALGTTFECLETRREEHTTPAGVVQPFTWVAGRIRRV